MLHVICLVVYAAASVAGLVLSRDDGPLDPGDAPVADPGLQTVPDTAKAPNTFSNGQAEVSQGFPFSADPIPDLYQPRNIDIPFGRVSLSCGMYFPSKHRDKRCERRSDGLSQRAYFVAAILVSRRKR